MSSHLTHWGRVTHICDSKQTIIGSDNGLSPGRLQAIIWTNAGILLIRTLGTNFSEILIEIRIFSLKKMGLKVSSAKWRPFCLGLNELMASWKRFPHCFVRGIHVFDRFPTQSHSSGISWSFFIVSSNTLFSKQSRAPFYWHGLTLIPTWISNYIHYKVWDEITYPFLNFNGATVEV